MIAAQRVLAVDFGDRRTGLAATDYTGTIIVPLDAVTGLDDCGCAKAIVAVAIERDTEAIVVGLPLNRHGESTARTERTREFIAVLEGAATCPVFTTDESHTTDEAHERLKQMGLKAAKRKRLADSVAAMIILERFRSG